MTKITTTGRLRRHSYGHDASYKKKYDPASEAKTCDGCGGYKPLTSFRRAASRGTGADAYEPICKECRRSAVVAREQAGPKNDALALLPSPETIKGLSEEECEQIFIVFRWPDGPRCPKCSEKHIYSKAPEASRLGFQWICSACGKQFSPTSGTPFAGRKAPMKTILTMLSLTQRNRGEIVIHRVATELGLQYKTAYTMYGKAVEFLSGGIEKKSAFAGYWRGASVPHPRTTIAAASAARACAECGDTKEAEAFGLKTGIAGAWGLRLAVCKDCVNRKTSVALSQTWARRKASELIPLFPPRSSDLAEKTGRREIASADTIPGMVTFSTSAELLSRGPRYRSADKPMWWSTRSNWTNQERQDLAVLCEAAVPVETAADILGRSPSSIAWSARDAGLVLAPGWSALVRSKRLAIPKRARLNLFYPFIQKERPSDADLLRVNDIVPHAFPEHMRADICQSIMLALYEGTITLAELEANRANLTWFAKKWRKEQAPWQEVLAPGITDDERPYHDTAADVWGLVKMDRVNDARRAREAYADHQPATQIEDVARHERRAAHWILRGRAWAAGGALPDEEEMDATIERGELMARDLSANLFRPWDRVRKHARDQLLSRYGLTLDRVQAEALIDFCRDRDPEQIDDSGEMHLFVAGNIRLPIIYSRLLDEVVTILPPGGGIGGGFYAA